MRRGASSKAVLGLLVSLTIALAAAAPASAAPCRYRSLTPTKTNLSKIRSAVRCLINRERTSRDIPRLKTSGALTTAARRHSNAMVHDHFFSHTSPTDGSTPATRSSDAGYPGRFIGENIAWGSGSSSTPRMIVSSWMNSPGHRANILDGDFKDWGVGIAIGGPNDASGATYTTTFGAKS